MNFRYYIFLLLISCGSNKTNNKLIVNSEINSNCPEDGVCTFEIIKNKSLQINTDGIGALYPVLNEGENHVLKFEYKRNEIADVQDGHYSEIIYLELFSNELDLQLVDTEMQQVKLLFGRFCYCKGQTGYYKITNGNLSIRKSNEDGIYEFNLNFKAAEVPQVITEINKTFQL